MAASVPKPSFTSREVLSAWWKILSGRAPMLSIEITRECPLRCPGCYAYGDKHLGGGATLRELSDLRGDALVEGVLALVDKHKPMHVSIVGGEPLIRHRELTRILPEISRMGTHTLVVTSAVIPIPLEWMKILRLRVAVSVDGLQPDHDIRRKPATYNRILQNIEGREVNIHCVVTRPMLARRGYLDEYAAFWSARPEVNRIWVSIYTPQMGEISREMLTREDRVALARQLPDLAARYPKLLFKDGMAQAFLDPPKNPEACLFAKMSVNYSADLQTRVEPCVFGGIPDCEHCGCTISNALHWIRSVPVAGPVKVDHFIEGSIRVGQFVNRLREQPNEPPRWNGHGMHSPDRRDLVHIQP